MTTKHQNFLDLCRAVQNATDSLHQISECEPHYAEVLEYLKAHPEEHDFAATCFANAICGRDKPAAGNIYLIRYLMQHFKWPEVLEAARQAWNDGGNAWYGHEVKKLIDIYGK